MGFAYYTTMKAVIDRAGRIVVPKLLRQSLGLKPGQLLEIRASDGGLEIEIAGKGLPRLTSKQVRNTLERVRRTRS
jgi:AbrB family looped-hinge helix DNA binding protein